MSEPTREQLLRALMWAFDRLRCDLDRAAQMRTADAIGKALLGQESPASRYQPNDDDDSSTMLGATALLGEKQT